jgi:hypothetical protein
MGMYGLMEEELKAHLRKLHNEELHNLCCSLNVIQALKMGNTYKMLTANNIKMNLRRMCGCGPD